MPLPDSTIRDPIEDKPQEIALDFDAAFDIMNSSDTESSNSTYSAEQMITKMRELSSSD